MEHKVTEQQIKAIKSMKDEAAQELMRETPEGKNSFYHAIGIMGGLAVRDKYSGQ